MTEYSFLGEVHLLRKQSDEAYKVLGCLMDSAAIKVTRCMIT